MIKNLQPLTDKTAIGLSLLCTAHCLALPLAIVLLPSLAALYLADEAFHLWMVIAVIPTSMYALTMGCRQHKRYQLLVLGVVGLTCLISAVALEKILLGDTIDIELAEKILTSIGSCVIAYGHYKNYQLCQQPQKNCECS